MLPSEYGCRHPYVQVAGGVPFVMPWSKNDYPDSMKNLDADVRAKAIEIANKLLKDGMGEGRAIAIATAQAKKSEG